MKKWIYRHKERLPDKNLGRKSVMTFKAKDEPKKGLFAKAFRPERVSERQTSSKKSFTFYW